VNRLYKTCQAKLAIKQQVGAQPTKIGLAGQCSEASLNVLGEISLGLLSLVMHKTLFLLFPSPLQTKVLDGVFRCYAT
jgi:hypothetical protein